jgi:hypothetical protein
MKQISGFISGGKRLKYPDIQIVGGKWKWVDKLTLWKGAILREKASCALWVRGYDPGGDFLPLATQARTSTVFWPWCRPIRGIGQWYSTCGTRTSGDTRKHLTKTLEPWSSHSRRFVPELRCLHARNRLNHLKVNRWNSLSQRPIHIAANYVNIKHRIKTPWTIVGKGGFFY